MMTKKKRMRKRTRMMTLKMRAGAERSLVPSQVSSAEWPRRTNPTFVGSEAALHAWTLLWKPASKLS
jgi:hypothetical protein